MHRPRIMQRPASASTVLILLLLASATALAACGGSIAPGDGNGTIQPSPTELPPPPSPLQPPPDTRPGPTPGPATTPPTPLPTLPPLPAADAPPPGGEAEHLQWMKQRILGTWRGVATTPWTAPYGVEITFGADLHYSAHCLDTSGCLAFYYGQDSDAPTRVYDLVDVLANHEGVGTIYVWPSAGSWTGHLQRVTFRGDASRLTFEFSNGNNAPILYDVVRVP